MKIFLRPVLISAGLAFLNACGGGSSAHFTPAAQSPAGTSPAQNFNASTVRVSVVSPLPNSTSSAVLSLDNAGAVYFGSPNPNAISPAFYLFLNNSASGSAGLWRYNAGTFTLTNPRGPYFASSPAGKTCNGIPIPSDLCSLGNVSAIDASDFSSVIWASDYAADASFIPSSELEWGGSGGVAATPPAPYNHDFESTSGDQIASILRASNGQIWIGGGGPSPDMYPGSVPAACEPTTIPHGCDIFFLVNGPNDDVWAMTRTYAPYASTPNGSAFLEYDASGSLIKAYTIPDVAVRIAGTSSAVWFTDFTHNAIGKIDAAGSVTEYKIPTANGGPYGIAVASDGAVWFTEYLASKVGRIDNSGHIDEFTVPFQPFSIATTAPGCAANAIWVGSLGSQLAEITGGS